MLAALLALAIATPPVAGAYPIVPAIGPLKRKKPDEQAELLARWGFTLAGGEFKDDKLPQALREHGVRTMTILSVFQGADRWKKHPESRPIDALGNPVERDQWYGGICPNDERLRRHKLNQAERRFRSGRYDVVVLDFVRWPGLWQRHDPKLPKTCYCQACRDRFQHDTGIQLPSGSVAELARWIDEHHLDEWNRWRATRITDFVREVKERRDRTGSKTKIGLTIVPWTDERLLDVAGQDLRALADAVDVFLPQSYFRMTGEPVEWVSGVNAFIAKETKKPVWPIVLFDDQRKLSPKEWDRYVSHALRGSNGLVVFPFASVPKSPGLPAISRQLREFAADERFAASRD